MADAPMNAPKFDWTVNVSTMLAIATVAGGLVTWGFTLREQVNLNSLDIVRVDTVQKDLILKRDIRVAEVDRKLAAVDEVRFRVQAVEEALKSTNARSDASLANISARLAEINVALGSLNTTVAVLTQRLDSDRPQRRADATPPR